MALELSTADVYEQASVIGQDIERIIDLFGNESVLDLMPKVIRVLEYLEVLVREREKENLEIAELKLENERLYVEIKKEANQRRRLDEELYQVNLQGEEENLQDVIATLKEENRKLRKEVELTVTERPGDVEVMQKMKEIIDNQRDAIRAKNNELESQRSDLEAMAEQLERLSNINQGLRRNLSVQQMRTNTLAKEKAALQTEVTALKQEQSHLQEQLEENENEQKANGETNGVANGHLNNNDENENKENETERQLITDKEKVGALSVVDKKDPNRPRFTRQELQDVLNERNQLKEEVLSLKEELAFYKPKEEDSKSPAKSPPTPQKEHRKSRNEESGISKIFNIFAKKEKTEDSQ